MSADPDALDRSAAAQRWCRVRDLFDMAADTTPDCWDEIVAREAGTDTALRAEVLRLLAAFQRDELALDDARLECRDSSDGTDRIGTTVAHYRLVRLIGRGGMGTVYEGVRSDGDFQHRVAVKFIRGATGAPDLAARFRRERQILATLEHRNIARLFDGGATAESDLYFVMEYVEGLPLTTYCNAQRLTVDQRLHLFRQVLAAVEHAHSRLIVHRDLKPANMLVAGDGSVKLLDFGVAKLLDVDESDELTTIAHERPYTPEYASPEQLRAEPASPASDVYALGIVLYEVLAGRRPYDLPSRSPIAALRAAESDTPKPSVVATADAAECAGEANVARLRRRLAGELDNILGKALRADMAMRYPSVERFDDDVRRWLAGLPVSAQPDSVVYRTRKFIRRHVAGVSAMLVIVVALVAAGILLLMQWRTAAAEHSWQMAVVAASSLDELGTDRLSHADLPAADSLLRRAMTLCKSRPEVVDVTPTCWRVLYHLGTAMLWRGNIRGAESLLQQVRTAVRAVPGQSPAAMGAVLSELGQVRDAAGDLVGAERLFRQAAPLFTQGGADQSADRLQQLGWFALSLERAHRFAEADSLVQLQRALLSGPDLGVALIHLASIHAEEGNLRAARTEAERGRTLAAPILTDTATLLYVRLASLDGLLRLHLGDVEGAIAELRAVLAVAVRRYPPDDPRIAEVQDALGEAFMASHHTADAAPLFQAAATTFRRRFGATHPQTITAIEHAKSVAQ